MACLLDVDRGRWVVGGIDAEAVRWAVVQGITAVDGWLADCHSTIDVGERAGDGVASEADVDMMVDVRVPFVVGGWCVGRLADADAEGGVGGLPVAVDGWAIAQGAVYAVS